MMPYGDIDLGQIGSDDGLLPDGTKPLPEQCWSTGPSGWALLKYRWKYKCFYFKKNEKINCFKKLYIHVDQACLSLTHLWNVTLFFLPSLTAKYGTKTSVTLNKDNYIKSTQEMLTWKNNHKRLVVNSSQKESFYEIYEQKIWNALLAV